jgi:hypothetical protein
MAAPYAPGLIQTEFSAEQLQFELEKIAAAMAELTAPVIILEEQNVAPERLAEGMIINADGTNFDPGEGKGLYQYLNGSWARLLGAHTYAEIYVDGNSTPTTINTQNVWEQVTVFNTNGESNGATPDHTNDHITINQAGVYLVNVTVAIESVSGGSAAEFQGEVFKNNGATGFSNLHFFRQMAGGGSDVGSAAVTGLDAFVANDTIELWVRNITNTSNLIIKHANLSVVRLGA